MHFKQKVIPKSNLECFFFNFVLFRYILLQFLILFQYLKSNVKFKTDTQVRKYTSRLPDDLDFTSRPWTHLRPSVWRRCRVKCIVC